MADDPPNQEDAEADYANLLERIARTYSATPLSTETAAQVGRVWLANESERRPEIRRGEFSPVIARLVSHCAGESLLRGETGPQLYDRITETSSILFEIYDATKYSSINSQNAHKNSKNSIWWRRDLLKIFSEGTSSTQFPKMDISDFQQIINRYILNYYIRDDYIDWLILEILITINIIHYGEYLKICWIRSTKDRNVKINTIYDKYYGNVSNMKKFRSKERWNNLRLWFFYNVIFPVCWVYALYSLGYQKSAFGVMVFCVAGTGIFETLRLFDFAKKRRSRINAFSVWDRMHEVWRRLEGPIVNPSRVREAMADSAKQGAVWDKAAWIIIDRVISIDPAVWVVGPWTTETLKKSSNR